MENFLKGGLDKGFVFGVQGVEQIFNFLQAVAFFGKEIEICGYRRVGKGEVYAFVFRFQRGDFVLDFFNTGTAFCVCGAFFLAAVISAFFLGLCGNFGNRCAGRNFFPRFLCRFIGGVFVVTARKFVCLSVFQL